MKNTQEIISRIFYSKQIRPKTSWPLIVVIIFLALLLIVEISGNNKTEVEPQEVMTGNIIQGECQEECAFILDPIVKTYEAGHDHPHPAVSRMDATVTAYTSSVDETDSDPFTNAAGTRPGPRSLACPAWMDFGTQVKIAGHMYVCDDRMNPKKQIEFNQAGFDIWMETKAEAFEWGKRKLTVEVYRN